MFIVEFTFADSDLGAWDIYKHESFPSYSLAVDALDSWEEAYPGCHSGRIWQQ